MKFKSFIIKPWFLIFISAIFSALPLSFENLFLLSWISFVPLFYVVIKHSEDKLRHAFGRGFLFGLVYHLCIYYWFLWFYPLSFAELSDGFSIAVVLLAWIGISIAHGVLWCLPFLICHIAAKINKNPLFLCFAAFLGILAAQKIPALGELSFPWARISISQYKATALIQTASLFGVDAVELIMLFVNTLITVCIISKSKKRIAAALCAAGVFSANLGFGLIKINTETAEKPLNIMTVQASVDRAQKWSEDGDVICYNEYLSLTKENFNSKIELILWPESAVPFVYEGEKDLTQYIELSKELDTPIVAGVLLQNDDANTNSAILIDKEKVISDYAKRRLVPFGEFMPYKYALSNIFPFLQNLNIIESDYVSGQDSAIAQVKDGSIGRIICFESIYQDLCRKSTLDGAQLLIEITNDSWLEDSPAMKQHLAHGVFRSVENGRYLVRSANSGISAVIDSHGRIEQTLAANEKGVITSTVYFNDNVTPYTKIGNVLFPVCVCAFLLISLTLLIKKLKTAE